MATITSKSIIRKMLQNDGVYPGDPAAYAIYAYINHNDVIVYSVFMRQQDDDMASSLYDYELLWSRATGLTMAGMLVVTQ